MNKVLIYEKKVKIVQKSYTFKIQSYIYNKGSHKFTTLNLVILFFFFFAALIL